MAAFPQEAIVLQAAPGAISQPPQWNPLFHFAPTIPLARHVRSETSCPTPSHLIPNVLTPLRPPPNFPNMPTPPNPSLIRQTFTRIPNSERLRRQEDEVPGTRDMETELGGVTRNRQNTQPMRHGTHRAGRINRSLTGMPRALPRVSPLLPTETPQ